MTWNNTPCDPHFIQSRQYNMCYTIDIDIDVYSLEQISAFDNGINCLLDI